MTVYCLPLEPGQSGTLVFKLPLTPLPDESPAARQVRTSLKFSPDGARVAGAFTDYRTSGIYVIDIASSSIRKLEEAKPVMIHPMDWYGSGRANPRWVVRSYSGVSFAPDGRSLVFCTAHENGGEEKDAEGFPTRRGLLPEGPKGNESPAAPTTKACQKART